MTLHWFSQCVYDYVSVIFQVSQEALNSYAKATDRTFKSQTATEISYYDSFRFYFEIENVD